MYYTKNIGDSGRQIAIHFTRGHPVNHILEDSASTAEVNFLNHSTCYSLFPQYTFKKPRINYYFGEHRTRGPGFVIKYREHGCPTGERFRDEVKLKRNREIGDSEIWTIHLNVDYLESCVDEFEDYEISETLFWFWKYTHADVDEPRRIYDLRS